MMCVLGALGAFDLFWGCLEGDVGGVSGLLGALWGVLGGVLWGVWEFWDITIHVRCLMKYQ